MPKNKEIEIPVKDRSGDRWIKIIGLVALFTFPLVGTIGNLILGKMDDMGKRQDMTLQAVGKINVFLGTHEIRIERNIKDISGIDKKFTLKDKETNEQ